MVLRRKLKSIIWLVALLYAVTGLWVIWKGFLSPDKAATPFPSAITASRHRFPEFPSLAESLRVLSVFQNRSYDRKVERVANPLGKGFGFLKVHKAASSTTQSLFLMYGWRRNMTFILPYEQNQYRYPNIISVVGSLKGGQIVPPPPNRTYEIVCHHVLYDRQAWDKFLPPKAPKIGTIRNPFTMFQSAVSYFKLHKKWNVSTSDGINDVLTHPSRYYETNHLLSFVNNRMSIEYGVDPDIIRKRDFARFEKYIYEVLDVDFTIVIVTEMFAESLVMMRRLLNWSLKDIVYLDKGQRPFFIALLAARRNPEYLQINPTDEMKELHKRFAVFDYILYDFFRKRLEKQISQEQHFYEEVKFYKAIHEEVAAFCCKLDVDISQQDLEHPNVTLVSQTMFVNASMWSETFKISRADCVLMKSNELKITQAIRKRQYGKARWYKMWG